MSDKIDTKPGVKHERFQWIDTKTKASAFIQFLHNETLRHHEDIINAEKDIKILCERWGLKEPKFKQTRWYETSARTKQ